ncbi:MAG: hypothetical protein Athens101410_222 [Parcubacteria group bacterium Athens1014_10]|nr:MAG: hypothetical protein Athens101410_222 [Parcubacteria group bacterium Athens1014_10]TSD04762.1 MAG: hypothetical protein Athens071412_637 [Parcubacteria group bacterium Athens0714_12]
MDNQNFKIAIIILNWNGLENTKECLNSLKKVNYSNFKIILVDNGSENNEGKILKNEYGDFITLIQNKKNLGFAEGNNVGIEKALENPEIKYILCLNNDTTVEIDFIEKALEKFNNPEIGMMAPKTMNYYKKNEIDNFGIQFTKSGLSFNIKNNNSRLFCPCGAAAFYSRELLEELKRRDGYYFDPDFFAYAEDLDLGFRARLLGFECLFAENSIIYHKGSASTKAMSDLAVYHTYRNIIWVLTKNLPAPLFWKYLPKIIIGQLAIIFLWILRGKSFLIFKAYFHALFGLPKMLKKRKIIQKNKKISIGDLNKFFTPRIFVKSYLSNLKI